MKKHSKRIIIWLLLLPVVSAISLYIDSNFVEESDETCALISCEVELRRVMEEGSFRNIEDFTYNRVRLYDMDIELYAEKDDIKRIAQYVSDRKVSCLPNDFKLDYKKMIKQNQVDIYIFGHEMLVDSNKFILTEFFDELKNEEVVLLLNDRYIDTGAHMREYTLYDAMDNIVYFNDATTEKTKKKVLTGFSNEQSVIVIDTEEKRKLFDEVIKKGFDSMLKSEIYDEAYPYYGVSFVIYQVRAKNYWENDRNELINISSDDFKELTRKLKEMN